MNTDRLVDYCRICYTFVNQIRLFLYKWTKKCTGKCIGKGQLWINISCQTKNITSLNVLYVLANILGSNFDQRSFQCHVFHTVTSKVMLKVKRTSTFSIHQYEKYWQIWNPYGIPFPTTWRLAQWVPKYAREIWGFKNRRLHPFWAKMPTLEGEGVPKPLVRSI
jgi:hypothetical protein